MSVIHVSTLARTRLMQGVGFQRLFQNGAIYRYSGTMPADADTASSGTLLDIITQSSGARTAEVLASATVTISGASGSVDNVKVTAAAIDLLCANQFSAATSVPFNGSLTQTAADVATQINKGTWWHGYTATSSGAIVTVKPLPGMGDSLNAADITATCTTLTTVDVDFASGVDPANGLQLGTASAGAIVNSGTWSGVGLAAGTVGWCRWIGSITDAMGASTTQIRMDMDAATAGAIMTGASMVVAVGATSTATSVSMTWPA
jgi:hypothetical protein